MSMLRSVIGEKRVVLTIQDLGEPDGSLVKSQPSIRIEFIYPAVDCSIAVEFNRSTSRCYEASRVEDTFVAGKPSVILSCCTVIANIGLLPTQVEECLRVATRILDEMRLDEAVAFGEVCVEVK